MAKNAQSLILSLASAGLLAACATNPAWAGPDSAGPAASKKKPVSELTWKEQLRRDDVEIRSGKFISEAYFLLSHPDRPDSLQFRLYSEGPASGVISRDTFVGVTSMLMLVEMLPIFVVTEAKNEELKSKGREANFKFREIDAPIGKVDYELTIIMTPEGYQTSMTNKNGTKRTTVAWKDFFDDN